MQLNQMPKNTIKRSKRVGRGYGSGKGGHTVGRGQKGQKSRNKVGILFEGTKMRKSLIKRLPFLRGKGKFKSQKAKPIIINLKYLNLLPEGSEVTQESLMKYNLIKAGEVQDYKVKILGDGELTKKLIVKLPTSKSAAIKIEKAGGKVVLEKGKSDRKRAALRETETKQRETEKSSAHSVTSVGSVLQKKHPIKARTKRVTKKTK